MIDELSSLEEFEQELTCTVTAALERERANDNSISFAAVRAAWSGGYYSAVIALREIAKATTNAELAANAHTLAGLLNRHGADGR